MEGKTSAPDAVVIAQDDDTNLRIQAMLQGGRRHVDVRIWRRGPAGFAPSRTGMVLEAADLEALQQGIRELLEASNNAQHVARVVWDGDDGRRLRAELEPFGTRFLARLGFWLRVRDTWRPAGEGLIVSADRLWIVLEILDQFRGWLSEEAPVEQTTQEIRALPPKREGLDRWPTAGADWLTVENERIALHPRGYRITASVGEDDGTHRVLLRQWRRDDSLWLPEASSVALTALDIDNVLARMGGMAERDVDASGYKDEDVALSDGSTVRISVREDEGVLQLSRRAATSGREPAALEVCLTLPSDCLGRFGRLLVESWLLLVRTLSEAERRDLEEAQHVLEIPIEPPPQPEPAAALTKGPEVPEQETAETEPEEVEIVQANDPEPAQVIPLGEFHMGHHRVALTLEDAIRLRLTWEERRIDLPLEQLEDLLEQVRLLYYDALRGYRGRKFLLDGPTPFSANVQTFGMSLYFTLQAGMDGKATSLSFPASEVPAFLDAAGSALAHS